MEPKRNPFLGPTKKELELIEEKIKEEDKNFDKKIKKIMNKLNKQT